MGEVFGFGREVEIFCRVRLSRTVYGRDARNDTRGVPYENTEKTAFVGNDPCVVPFLLWIKS